MTATATDSPSKRTEANLRNAKKSSGPRTQAGKDRSRFNALKHGMRAKLPVLPGEDPDALQARLASWTAICQPADDIDRYLVKRTVNVSWQLDRADRTWEARLKRDLLDAGADQAAAIADEVLVLGGRLFHDPRGPACFYPQGEPDFSYPTRVSHSGTIDDPNEPARVVNKLEGTAPGCAWLLDRWNDLRELLMDGQKWRAPDRFRAIRLLGKQPLGMMDDERVPMIYLACDAMDPQGKSSFLDVANELNPGEPERCNQWLADRDVKRKAPADAEAGREALLALVSEEEERLEELLARRLESESAAAEARLGFDDTAEGERLRRYQLACHRTLMRILEQLRKRRAERIREGRGDRGEGRGKAGGSSRAGRAGAVAGIEDATNEPNASASVGAGLPTPPPPRPKVSTARTRRTNPTPRQNPFHKQRTTDHQ